MARAKLNLPYAVRKNTNNRLASNNKYYPMVLSSNTLSQAGLAEHMVSHGLIRNKNVIYNMLSKLSVCVPELLSQGIGVQLDNLGTIYPSLSSKGAERPQDFNINVHLTGVHIRFKPWDQGSNKLTSKALKNRCNFQFVGVYQGTKKDKNRVLVNAPVEGEQGGGE